MKFQRFSFSLLLQLKSGTKRDILNWLRIVDAAFGLFVIGFDYMAQSLHNVQNMKLMTTTQGFS